MEKRVKGKPCWLTSDIRKVMNERDQVLRKARRTRSENTWSTYKRLRNSCNNMMKQARSKYHKNMISENFLDPFGKK